MRRLSRPTALVSAMFATVSVALADTCKPEQFAAAIDASGAALRAFNAETQPKLKERIRGLKDKKQWGDDYEDRAYEYLQDGRIAEFDARSNELVDKIDTIGRKGESGMADCEMLGELKSKGEALLNVMKEKSAYMIGKVELETGATPSANKVAAPVAKTAAAEPQSQPTPEPKPSPSLTPPKQQPKPAAQPWNTETKPAPPSPAPPSEVATLSPPTPIEPPIPQLPVDTGYTLEEIRDASKGFFGNLSGSLASVIEHTFRNSGKPTGYILGTEGGGALLAGLRYGEGTLYLHRGVAEKIYWHGPSIGTDVGASGSRTLFLIYNLQDKNSLFRAFSGVDGSAYLVGGVGMTLMKGGDVVMAPIRSGLGIRIGASIGYLKFTSRPTWNPF